MPRIIPPATPRRRQSIQLYAPQPTPNYTWNWFTQLASYGSTTPPLATITVLDNTEQTQPPPETPPEPVQEVSLVSSTALPQPPETSPQPILEAPTAIAEPPSPTRKTLSDHYGGIRQAWSQLTSALVKYLGEYYYIRVGYSGYNVYLYKVSDILAYVEANKTDGDFAYTVWSHVSSVTKTPDNLFFDEFSPITFNGGYINNKTTNIATYIPAGGHSNSIRIAMDYIYVAGVTPLFERSFYDLLDNKFECTFQQAWDKLSQPSINPSSIAFHKDWCLCRKGMTLITLEYRKNTVAECPVKFDGQQLSADTNNFLLYPSYDYYQKRVKLVTGLDMQIPTIN